MTKEGLLKLFVAKGGEEGSGSAHVKDKWKRWSKVGEGQDRCHHQFGEGQKKRTRYAVKRGGQRKITRCH